MEDVMPTALDWLRAQRAQVARVHDERAQFNPLTGGRGHLGGAVAQVEAAISAAQSARGPDPQEIVGLSVELDKARSAVDRLMRKHRDDRTRVDQLGRDYATRADLQAIPAEDDQTAAA